jgi:hypothetical protein
MGPDPRLARERVTVLSMLKIFCPVQLYSSRNMKRLYVVTQVEDVPGHRMFPAIDSVERAQACSGGGRARLKKSETGTSPIQCAVDSKVFNLGEELCWRRHGIVQSRQRVDFSEMCISRIGSGACRGEVPGPTISRLHVTSWRYLSSRAWSQSVFISRRCL